MRLGIAVLMFGYVLSQFYRAFLAVLAPVLEYDLGLSKQDLASASGYWFLTFAAMQLPVGAAFDRIGPRITTTVCLAVAAAGAALFAMAGGAGQIKFAMALIGIGCAPILMASYFIFARQFSPALFGTLAGVTVGVGSFGDIIASVPLALLNESIGWRAALWIMAGVTALTMAAVFALVRDPPRLQLKGGGSVLSVLTNRAIWPVLAMMLVCYATPSALRGLWLGPYFHDVWGLSNNQIGWAGLAMGLGLVTGSLIIGPIGRMAGTTKWVVVGSNTVMLIAVGLLWLQPERGILFSAAMFVLIGIFGSTFPMVTAHARNFIAPEIMGRGVTLVNLCGMIGVGLAQKITGPLHSARLAGTGGDSTAAFAAIFGFFTLATVIGLGIYLFSKERRA